MMQQAVSRPLQSPRAAAGLTRWSWLAATYGVIVALGLGYFLLGVSLQVSDCLGNLLQVSAAPLWDIVKSNFTGKGFLRPFLWAQLKIFYEISNGHYYLTFRTFHVLQVVVLLLLFVRVLRVRTACDMAVLPLATAVLVGIHTCAGTVNEAFPINTFMTILVCCLAAVNLSYSRGGRWVDWAAVGLFVYALLTVESGLLVWVCLVTGYLVGVRGVSRRAVITVTALTVLYFVLRFGPLGVGSPAMSERSSGFGFSVREPDELIGMFGGRPWLFYAYNVVCSVATVLFSEPRAGVWEFTRSIVRADTPTWMTINVVSSVLATALMIRFTATRARKWLRCEFDHHDRLFIVFVAMLLANAVISFPYTKDVIVSPAGVFYAIAVFVAVRDVLLGFGRPGVPIPATAAVSALLLVTSAAWTVRAAGLHYNLRQVAFVQRNDWAQVDEWLTSQGIAPKNPEGRALVDRLRADALGRSVPNPFFLEQWAEEYFDRH